MGNLKDKLLAASKLRSEVVEIEGEKFTVQEADAVSFADYGALLKKDRMKATATLLAECVVDENGSKLLTVEEATQVVRSNRVSMPLMQAIMKVSGFGDDEKESDASRDVRLSAGGSPGTDGEGDARVDDSTGVSRMGEVLEGGAMGSLEGQHARGDHREGDPSTAGEASV